MVEERKTSSETTAADRAAAKQRARLARLSALEQEVVEPDEAEEVIDTELDAAIDEIEQTVAQVETQVRAASQQTAPAELQDLNRQAKHLWLRIQDAREASGIEDRDAPRPTTPSPAPGDPQADRLLRLVALNAKVTDLRGELGTVSRRARRTTEHLPPVPVVSPTPPSAIQERSEDPPSDASVDAVLARVDRRARPVRVRRRLAIPFAAAAAAGVCGLLIGWWTNGEPESTGATDPVAPTGAAYVRTLDQQLTRLADQRLPNLDRLRRARSAPRQAAASGELAGLHARAADQLERTSPPVELRLSNLAVVRSLERMAGGYREMADGATSRNRARYAAGGAAVQNAAAVLRRSLRAAQTRLE